MSSEQSLLHFFQIKPTNLQRFSKSRVNFTRSRLLRLYEIKDGKISPVKELHYFRQPKLSEYPLDLNEGFETYHYYRVPGETKVLMSLNHEMTENGDEKAMKNNDRCIDMVERTNVYTCRSILGYIMQFCYAPRDDRNILISKNGGKLYLFEIEGEWQEREKKPVYGHHSRLCRLLFVDEPNGLPNLDEPHYNCDTHYSLISTSLGKFDINHSGEVKGIISDTKFNQINDINAVNRNRFVLAKQMWAQFKNKDFRLMNYWTEAYLANVEDFYIAYKDKDGIVRDPIEHLKVYQMPENRRWKPVVCKAFLNEFLERVEQLMRNVDSFETVYEFHFKAQEKTIQYEIHEGKSEKIAIPKEYIEFTKKRGC